MSDEIKPEVLKRALEEARADELADETAQATPKERADYLAKAGVTDDERKAMRARQRKMFEERRAATPAVPKRAAERRRVSIVWAASGWGALAAAAALVLVLRSTGTLQVSVGPTATATVSTATQAGSPPPWDVLRERAFRACGVGKYAECLADLDRAKALDPEGDRAEDVVRARAIAERSPR